MFYDKEYYRKYREAHREEIRENQRRFRIRHKERLHKEQAVYYQANKKKILEKQKKWYKKNRLEVLNVVSNNNPICVRCGCDNVRLLEINHKTGGGREETNGKYNTKFYSNILNGTRKVNDLEILCKVCNAWHALELKYGELPYKISYSKRGGN